MKMLRCWFCIACLVTTGFVLVGCSGSEQGMIEVSPSVLPCPELTKRLDTGTLEPTGTEPDLTSIGQPADTTEFAIASSDIRLVKITDQGNISDVHWSKNGQSVVYTTYIFDDQGVQVKGWYEYEVTCEKLCSIDPPFALDHQVWEQLEATRPGAVSPSGTRVLYIRPSPTCTPAPGEFVPLVEIWAAQADGSNALRLGGPGRACQTIGQVIWFDQERKMIFDCGYEGPPDIIIASMDERSLVSLSAVTAFDGLLGGGMALSPDEMKLALTDASGVLQVVSLDSGEVQSIARWGYAPNWSPDSRRLYYLQGQEEFTRFGNVHIYDLDTGTNAEFLVSPIHAPDGTDINIAVDKFVVSPLENAAVFQSRGLWLVTWFP